MKIDLRSEHSESLAYMKKKVLEELETKRNGISMLLNPSDFIEAFIASITLSDIMEGSTSATILYFILTTVEIIASGFEGLNISPYVKLSMDLLNIFYS